MASYKSSSASSSDYDDNKKPLSSPNTKYMVYGATVVVYIVVLCLFYEYYSHNRNANETKAANTATIPSNIISSNLRNRDKCASLWRSDELVGRCFGLKNHSEYNALSDVKFVQNAEHCQALCCKLDEKCISWQYWNDIHLCKLGGQVRVGTEAGGTANWCEPSAPLSWSGHVLESREGSSCIWGQELPTQCFGLGPEKVKIDENNEGVRRTEEECAAACCASPTCQIWQYTPEKGCFFGSNRHAFCEPYKGTYTGGRKCVDGDCNSAAQTTNPRRH